MNGRPTGFSCYQYRQGSSSHTLSRASASVDFALLSDRWKCFAVSFNGWYTSSSKPYGVFHSAFYQLFDEGVFEDQNYYVRLEKSVIICTSNYHSIEEIRKELGDAIYNRFDVVIGFNELSENAKIQIASKYIEDRKKIYEEEKSMVISEDIILKLQNYVVRCNNVREIQHLVDEYYEFQQRCPKGIFSYGTSAYFWNLSDRVPNVLSCTVPRGYNTSRLKIDTKVKYHYLPKDLYDIGIVEIISPQGAKIRVYDRERTICDLIRDRKKVDMQLYSNALNVYFKSREKNIRKLMKYGKAFRITEELEKYMEVLQ